MPTSLADYSVIHRGKLTVSRDQRSHVERFDVYDDIVRPDERSRHVSKRPVLFFYADPSGDAKNLRCTIEMGGVPLREVFNYQYSGGTGRAHSVVLDHEDVYFNRRDATHRSAIQIQYISGEGSVSFSDIILWYQRWI
jgi:hypothetical protein